MKKRFIICINNSTVAQEKAFVNYLNLIGLGWWHWLTNTWLISDHNGVLEINELRDKAVQIFGNAHLMVFELSNGQDSWTGYGPNKGEKNMGAWLNDEWNKY